MCTAPSSTCPAEDSGHAAQGDHHLGGDGLDSYAVDVAVSADHRGTDRRRGGRAIEAGAAIVHLHARKSVDGRPDQTPEAFLPFVRDIKARTNGVINITTDGAPTMSVQERMQPALQLKPESACGEC